MKAKNAFLRLFSRSAGKVHVAGEFVSMPTHGGDILAKQNLRSFWDVLKNSVTSTANLVHVTPNHVEISHPPLHSDERRQRRVTSAVALTARGSVALSRLPIVTEEEQKARKARALAYDFSSNY